MLVAIVLAEALLMQDDTGNRGKHIDIVMPAYEQRTLQDDGAARVYADPTLLRNSDGSIRVLREVRELQKYGGELAQRKCHELADALERSLLNK